jgi:hypothetical protein
MQHSIPKTNPDLAADSAKLERMECGHLRAEWVAGQGTSANRRASAFGSHPEPSYCLGCLREQRLVQVVVERAAHAIMEFADINGPHGTAAHQAVYSAAGVVRQLSSPENVAALIAEAKGEK